MHNYQQMKKLRRNHQVKLDLILRIFYQIFFFSEDPYFVDEELLTEREALLTEEDKEVILFSSFPKFILSS